MYTVPAVLPIIHKLLLISLPLIGYVIYTWMFGKKTKNLPPGPREWGTSWKLLKASLNGSLPSLATEWAKKYGEITYVAGPGQKLLLLNSAEVSRKLLASDEYKFLFADRLIITAAKIADFNGKDLIFSKFDAIMKKKRRIFHTVLNLYGDGVAKFEDAVWAVMERMFAEIDDKAGKDLEITNILVHSLKDIISCLAIGHHVDRHVSNVLEEYDIAFGQLSTTDVDFAFKYFPFIAKIPGRIKTVMDRFKRIKKDAEELIYYKQKKTHIPGQPRGIVDLLLDLQKKPGYEWLANDETHITAFLTTLFMSAHLTSRASLNAMFLCLLNYPGVAVKIQGEIDAVIGSERPHIKHRGSMNFTEAAIIEIQRLISQVALSGFRIASQDITFEGMTIPKDTMLMMNGWYFHHDETIWEDPWTYKPERFLDNEGCLLPADHPVRKNLIPFGVGVRACPGETFARSRVFLIVTSVLQRYDLHPPAGEKLAPADFFTDVDDTKSVVRQVPPFRGRLTPRQKAN